MAYYPLYDKQKQMALSNAQLDKRVFEMNKRFARNFETELKQSSSPIPPHVKVEYLNLIDKCVTELEYIVENTDVYGVFTGSLNSRDFRKYFKALALYYKTYIYPYLNQDRVLQMNSLRALSQLSTLLEQVIGIAETSKFTDKTFLKKALITLNKMMNNIDLDYSDLNNADISKMDVKQSKDMNIHTELPESKDFTAQTEDVDLKELPIELANKVPVVNSVAIEALKELPRGIAKAIETKAKVIYESQLPKVDLRNTDSILNGIKALDSNVFESIFLKKEKYGIKTLSHESIKSMYNTLKDSFTIIKDR